MRRQMLRHRRTAQSPLSSRRSCMFESLEARRLLSTIVLSNAGVMTITGSNGGENINVAVKGGKLIFIVVGSGGTTKTVTPASVKSVIVDAKDGNDQVNLSKLK